jgi:hypothetical protein
MWAVRIGTFGEARPLGPTVMLRGGVESRQLAWAVAARVIPIRTAQKRHAPILTPPCSPSPTAIEGFTMHLTTAIRLGLAASAYAIPATPSPLFGALGAQAGLGAAIKASTVARKDLFVMSMVPTYLMGYNETRAAVAASLAQLQVDYIDLLMV